MGSVFSKPKMPSSNYAPVVVDNTPVTIPKSGSDGVDPPTGSGGSVDVPEVTPDEQRVQNILSRNRGRLGTISTSFNGILSSLSNTPVRKTLLGE